MTQVNWKLGAGGLAAARAVLAVFAVDLARAEFLPRERRFAGMMLGHVRAVGVVVGDAHDLPVRTADPSQPRAEPIEACTLDSVHDHTGCATGGISWAVGLACLSARSEMVSA